MEWFLVSNKPFTMFASLQIQISTYNSSQTSQIPFSSLCRHHQPLTASFLSDIFESSWSLCFLIFFKNLNIIILFPPFPFLFPTPAMYLPSLPLKIITSRILQRAWYYIYLSINLTHINSNQKVHLSPMSNQCALEEMHLKVLKMLKMAKNTKLNL